MVYYVEHNRKSRLTVKGKDQGRESIENHHFHHNFGTKCRRENVRNMIGYNFCI